MALIKCSECGQDVSEEAPVCPHCGKPLKPVTIELTTKKWKFAKLISWLLFLGGLLILANGAGNGGFDNPVTGFGLTLMFFGFFAIMISKFGAWWSNK